MRRNNALRGRVPERASRSYRDDDADRPIRIVYSTYLNPPQDPSGSGSKCRAFSPGTLRVCLKIKWNN